MSQACTCDEAVIRKTEWRGEVIHRYCVALVRRAVELSSSPTPYLNNDDVPAEYQPRDKTTVGAAFRLLLAAGVLAPWRGNIEAAGIWGGMRRSARPENNGHRNQLYLLTSRPIAEEWLRRNGVDLSLYRQVALPF